MSEAYTNNPETTIEGDLSLRKDFENIPGALDEIIGVYGSANQAYESLGRDGLVQLLAHVSPETSAYLDRFKDGLAGDPGVVIVHNTGVDTLPDESAQLLSISLSSVFGTPTKTDRKLAQVAWPIKYDPNTNVQRTFSQSLGEAAFHTDTQYFEDPEDYFGLYCIEADEIGKGTNELLHVDAIVEEVAREHGEETLVELAKPYPFRVPSVFTETGLDDDVEIVWAPILGEDLATIRYRKDTLDNALKANQVELDPAQIDAMENLESVLQNLDPTKYHLQPGDAILINNKRLVHARTSFDNPERSLYRVRMNDDE